MSKSLSIYLYLARIMAATVVFLTHASDAKIGDLKLGVFSRFGHDAVVIFFVLSGIAIAYTADTRDHDPRSYAINRLARLWSVVVPAILLTIAVNLIVLFARPDLYLDLYPAHPIGDDVFSVLTSLFFVNQLWFIDVNPLSNMPFWSLGFEAWYYLMFGLAVFGRGARKYRLLALSILIMGPKIILLLPIWLLGVAYYKYPQRERPVAGLILMVAPLALYGLFRAANLSEHLNADNETDYLAGHLGMAGYFLSDYIVAILFTAHLVGFRMAQARIAGLVLPFERPIKFAAACTFSMYLYHYPLLTLFSMIIPRGNYLIIPAVVLSVIALASVTEQRKGIWRRGLGWAFARWQPARTSEA